MGIVSKIVINNAVGKSVKKAKINKEGESHKWRFREYGEKRALKESENFTYFLSVRNTVTCQTVLLSTCLIFVEAGFRQT